MSKIICEICGTSYPETADQCPICGCSRESAAQMLGDDLLDDAADYRQEKNKGNKNPSKKREIFDFDEVNAGGERPEEEEETVEAEEEEESRSNGFVVVLLTILILVLLGAAGFLFFRYIAPKHAKEPTKIEPVVTSPAMTEAPTEARIPCESLVLTSGSSALLSQPGGRFLLHVTAVPADTTDKVEFTSADESIATVTSDGRVEAVGEGETTVVISCGDQRIEFSVTVDFLDETTAPEETAAVEGTEGSEENAAPADGEEPAATSAPAAPSGQIKPGVKLKLKRKDISLGVYYSFQLLLDCDLEQNEVEWSSEHPHIATVDSEGNVKAIKRGTTSVTAKYGDQEVSCIVRCG